MVMHSDLEKDNFKTNCFGNIFFILKLNVLVMKEVSSPEGRSRRAKIEAEGKGIIWIWFETEGNF